MDDEAVPEAELDTSASAQLDERIRTLKQQIDKIETTQLAADTHAADSIPVDSSTEEYWRNKVETDKRSVYVGQVDYSVSPGELAKVMELIGTVNRVTIMCDKWTGHSKGYAYVEFETAAEAAKSMKFNFMPYRGRSLKVSLKRTNVPWFIAKRWGGYENMPTYLQPVAPRLAGMRSRGFSAFHGLQQSWYTPYNRYGYKGGKGMW
ncbi:Polyadenylate-binding protein 2 [Diplonema papillatum]|nr:Polyadenylate-binding protein 2 [Diplonema papillatum]